MNFQKNCELPRNVMTSCDPRWCETCDWARRTDETEPEPRWREDEIGLLIGLGWLQVALLVLKCLGVPWPWWAVLLPLEAVAGFAAVLVLGVAVWVLARLRRAEPRKRGREEEWA